MNLLDQTLQISAEFILPLAYGLAVFALLMLIRRLLRPYRTLDGVTIPYVLGALVAGVAIGLGAALRSIGAPIDSGQRNLLLALLICRGCLKSQLDTCAIDAIHHR